MSGGTKIFVYGINRSCPKDILEDKFAKHGAVSDVYITEKGYAFVTMNDENEARAAIDELNGSNIDGQEVIFNNYVLLSKNFYQFAFCGWLVTFFD
jgi:RNA recognition motif-containing protein